eukprot:tig00020878_g14866.t1
MHRHRHTYERRRRDRFKFRGRYHRVEYRIDNPNPLCIVLDLVPSIQALSCSDLQDGFLLLGLASPADAAAFAARLAPFRTVLHASSGWECLDFVGEEGPITLRIVAEPKTGLDASQIRVRVIVANVLDCAEHISFRLESQQLHQEGEGSPVERRRTAARGRRHLAERWEIPVYTYAWNRAR